MIQKIIIVLAFLWPSVLNAQKNIYVSPDGNDANTGSQGKPLASLSKALAKARKTRGEVKINVMEGTYYLSQPIVFTHEDSRKDGEILTVSNFENQKVIISGGVELKLEWKEYRNGIWQAYIKEDFVFDELYVNGQLQHMARYPNFDSTARFLGGTAPDALSTVRVALWKSPEGGYVHALHPYEWGDIHYIIKGKNQKGELDLQGGWQNNRRMGMHEKYRFVENIFEELDTVFEWFYDNKAKMLYYFPPLGMDIKTARFETPQIAHLFEFKGAETKPVKNISLEGLTLSHTKRTFMENKEPLLRSDWTIYRGGAVFFDGAVNCSIKNCTLTNLGGNAVFFNNFNSNCEVSGCMISETGASAFCFVGDPNAVRSPSFEYGQFIHPARIDSTPGPKSNNYPANCMVYDNLIFNSGLIEKQSAGVQLSMCQSITVSHNTIYDVPRAGINVSEGTWGGHIIEYNDVFNTVKESGDHGSFNSWGRDRFWHPDKKVLDSIVKANFDLALLDVVKPIIIRNNRMRCDHGWDIDLDDGSSNYLIYNNLCLNGGIKLREGVNRIVENNILINNTFHPHVWFKNSNDVFRYNVISTAYQPIHIEVWGRETDFNAFPDSASLKAAQERGTDKNSVCGDLIFVNSADGDFRLKDGSVALSIGFKNFTMDSFGVISPQLKAKAKKVPFPVIMVPRKVDDEETMNFMGARVKNLSTLGERSATGMDDTRGVLVVEVSPDSEASGILQVNDVILSFNNRQINNLQDLIDARISVIGTNTEVVVFRNQKKEKSQVIFKNK